MRCIVCALLLSVTLLPTSQAQVMSASADSVSRQLDSRQYREALQALAPLLKQDGANAGLLILRGRAQMSLRQYADAVASFRQAVKLAPRNGRDHYWLGQALAQRIPQVSVFSKSSLASDLRNAYQRAVQLAPDFIPAREALLDFYVQAPGFFGGSFAKAREHAAIIASLDPARGTRAQAIIAVAEGHTYAAIKDYKNAISQAPDDAGLRLELGELYLKHKHPTEACVLFRQTLNLSPDNVEALEQLGAAAQQSGQHGDLQAGARALQRLIAESPEGMSMSMAAVRQHLDAIQSMLQTSARKDPPSQTFSSRRSEYAMKPLCRPAGSKSVLTTDFTDFMDCS